MKKKYFTEKDYYSLSLPNKKRNSIYDLEFSNQEPKLVKIHKLLIKCKSDFSEDKEVQFLDKSGNIVGYLIIRSHINIRSNRKVTFVKILRKSHKEQDIKAIERNILDNNIVDKNNNIVSIKGIVDVNAKIENEEALKIFHKHMLSHYYSRLGVSFLSEIEIDEIEIDDIKSLSVRFHKDVQTKYLEMKGIKKENYKDHLLFFISPIHHTDNMASVFYDNVYLFSVMIYGFVDVAILHEVAHKMGLSHTFKDNYLTDTINETQKNINKNKYSEWNDIYQKNKNRKNFTYGKKKYFKF